MKTHLLLLFFTLLTLTATSQNQFERGYYIDNSNERVDCLIKNVDWKSNPTAFTYKLSDGGEEIKADISSVKEFGIADKTKFIRSTVNIDRSSSNVSELSFTRNPEFTEEQLFLKVLIEGQYTLYFYEDSNLSRFFFGERDTEKIDQLVFKKYETDERKIRENNLYKQQLLNNLKCTTITSKDVENLTYSRRSLVNFFVKYNQCSNPEFVNYEEKRTKSAIKIAIRPRINSSSFSVTTDNPFSLRNTDFGTKTSLGLGAEIEFILPFNNGMWALVMEPTYQGFSAETISPISTGVYSKASYNSIEIHAGLRRYFFINQNSKIFLNASVVFDLENQLQVEYRLVGSTQSSIIEYRSLNSLAFGVGYDFKNKFSIEGRFQTERAIVNSDELRFQTPLSIILGYRIKNK